MRVVAICAIVIFVAWASEQALTPPTIVNRGIAPPVYAVEQPVASTLAVPPGASIPPVTPTLSAGLNAVQSPAEVDVPPERGVRLQVTPTVPPPAPLLVIPHYDEWVALARCESGGNWSINTGNGYYGGLQFALTSWKGAGGQQYAAYPHMASAAQQMLTAEVLLDMQGWGAWPSCSRRLGLR